MVATPSRGSRPLTQRSVDVDEAGTHLLEAPRKAAEPVLYLHGNPTASWVWTPFLERSGGIAPDLPGFGRSELPREFDCSLDAYVGFLRSFVTAHLAERFALVVHDIGAIVGLVLAQRIPERISRLVIMNHAPLLAGYRWHAGARLWRRPGVGEAAMRLVFTRSAIHRVLYSRKGERLPEEFLANVRAALGPTEKRAILALYRSMSERDLAQAGLQLADITAPTLVVWSTEDPYIPARFGADYTDAIGGNATLHTVEGAGHWMWLEQPNAVERVASFLEP